MKTLLPAVILIFAVLTTHAQNASPSHKDSLEAVIGQYYMLNLKVFQANSTPVDINAVFTLFTDDFTYVHPKYGGTYTRQDLYEGYLRNQKNGAYDGKITDIKIHNKITGLNAVVVEKSFVETSNGQTIQGPPEMTLFEFKDGKICRIFEYW